MSNLLEDRFGHLRYLAGQRERQLKQASANSTGDGVAFLAEEARTLTWAVDAVAERNQLRDKIDALTAERDRLREALAAAERREGELREACKAAADYIGDRSAGSRRFWDLWDAAEGGADGR